MPNCEMSGCMLPSANEWMQDILPMSQRPSHPSEIKVKRRPSQLMKRSQANRARNDNRVYFSYHSSLLPLKFPRDNTSTSVIQPLQTDAVQSEEVAGWIRHPGALPSPPTSPALPRHLAQPSTSKLTHADPLAQFYEQARAQQRLKEDGVSVNHRLQPFLLTPWL